MSSINVSVLIVNYNGAQYLGPCLTALEKQTLPRHRYEVIVFDNASTDSSMNIASKFPWCRCLRSGRNLGFAGGNNAAARFAHFPTLVLLNNDTLPDPYWLEELVRVIERHPGRAVVSKLVFASDPTILNSGGIQLLRDGRGADAGFGQRDDGRYETNREVFAGCGAALALPASDPLFDASLFMYYEDLDAGWRATANGLPTLYAPRALVRHAVGAAGGEGSPRHRFHADRNRALTSLKHADAFLAIASGLILLAKAPQAVLRVVTGQWSRQQGGAVVRAFVSYLSRLPGALVARYLTRCGPMVRR